MRLATVAHATSYSHLRGPIVVQAGAFPRERGKCPPIRRLQNSPQDEAQSVLENSSQDVAQSVLKNSSQDVAQSELASLHRNLCWIGLSVNELFLTRKASLLFLDAANKVTHSKTEIAQFQVDINLPKIVLFTIGLLFQNKNIQVSHSEEEGVTL